MSRSRAHVALDKMRKHQQNSEAARHLVSNEIPLEVEEKIKRQFNKNVGRPTLGLSIEALVREQLPNDFRYQEMIAEERFQRELANHYAAIALVEIMYEELH